MKLDSDVESCKVEICTEEYLGQGAPPIYIQRHWWGGHVIGHCAGMAMHPRCAHAASREEVLSGTIRWDLLFPPHGRFYSFALWALTVDGTANSPWVLRIVRARTGRSRVYEVDTHDKDTPTKHTQGKKDEKIFGRESFWFHSPS